MPTPRWSPLALVYIALAVAGLAGTLVFNVLTVVQMRDVLADIAAGGPFVTALNIDLLVAAVAGAVFIIVEARRLGMRFGWLYVAAALVTAFAFVFPLFLAMRQHRLDARRDGADSRTGPGVTPAR